MNHVYLSDVVEQPPRLVSLPEETPHAVMTLTVSHRTASGIVKKEQYKNDMEMAVEVCHVVEPEEKQIVFSIQLYPGSMRGQTLLNEYFRLFLHLPDVPNDISPFLPFLHGEEFSWTSHLDFPTLQYGNWCFSLTEPAPGKPPAALFEYVRH